MRHDFVSEEQNRECREGYATASKAKDSLTRFLVRPEREVLAHYLEHQAHDQHQKAELLKRRARIFAITWLVSIICFLVSLIGLWLTTDAAPLVLSLSVIFLMGSIVSFTILHLLKKREGTCRIRAATMQWGSAQLPYHTSPAEVINVMKHGSGVVVGLGEAFMESLNQNRLSVQGLALIVPSDTPYA